jgi:hypothetical protein
MMEAENICEIPTSVSEDSHLHTRRRENLEISLELYQYSVRLRAGRPGDRGSIPDRSKELFL